MCKSTTTNYGYKEPCIALYTNTWTIMKYVDFHGRINSDLKSSSTNRPS